MAKITHRHVSAFMETSTKQIFVDVVISSECMNPESHYGYYVENFAGNWNVAWHDIDLDAETDWKWSKEMIEDTRMIIAADFIPELPNFKEGYEDLETIKKFKHI